MTRPESLQTVGVLGAGKLGLVIANLAVTAGYAVRVAGSGDPKYIALSVAMYAKGAKPTTAREAVDGADLVVLAVPLHRVQDLPSDALSGHVVVDSTNHWEAVDGPMPAFTNAPGGTSSVVAEALPGTRLVKALGHVAYEQLSAHARDERRVAIGIASDDSDAAEVVAGFIRAIGFEPVHLGALAAGVALQPGSLAFGSALHPDALLRIVTGTPS